MRQFLLSSGRTLQFEIAAPTVQHVKDYMLLLHNEVCTSTTGSAAVVNVGITFTCTPSGGTAYSSTVQAVVDSAASTNPYAPILSSNTAGSVVNCTSTACQVSLEVVPKSAVDPELITAQTALFAAAFVALALVWGARKLYDTLMTQADT